MIWAVLVAAALFAFAKSRGFRIVVVVVAMVAAMWIAVMLERDHSYRERGKTLVTPDQLSFLDLRMVPEADGGGYYHLSGRVRNNTPHQVVDIKLHFFLQDCDSAGHCDVIGDESNDVSSQIAQRIVGRGKRERGFASRS